MVEKAQQSIRNFLLWESFGKKDKPLFFGRDRETKLLYDKTFASNLLLLYGPSGAGKTSLMRCGLGNMFEESDWFPILIRKGDNIIKSLSVALRRAADDPEKLRNNSIAEKVHYLFLEKFRPIFLIFDQFEELFILGDRREQDQFFRLLMDLMAANFQCKIILSIKEDYLADLDRYEEAIPVLFYNRMRVERMRTEQLEEVVRGMTRNVGIHLGGPDDGPMEQEEIIRDIFGKVRDDTHRIDLGELQTFLDELFLKDELRRRQEEEPLRPICFDRPLIQDIEYVDVVIARRLQKKLEDLDLRFKHEAGVDRLPYLILRELVTEMETKRTRTVEDIEKHLFALQKVPPDYIDKCIDALVNGGILRNLSKPVREKEVSPVSKKNKVEIIHDNLAKKLYPLLFSEERNIIRVKNFILIQYETYLEAGVKLSKEDLEYIQPFLTQIRDEIPESHMNFIKTSRREVNKRQLRWVAFLVGISLFLLASSVIAIFQWSSSNRKSIANHISAKALDALSYDRTLALRYAEVALEKDAGNTSAKNVLHDVLIDAAKFPFYQEVYEIGVRELSRINDMDVSWKDKYLLAGSLDGGIHILNLWSQGGLKEIQLDEEARHKEEVTDVDFIGDQEGIKYGFLTGSKDGTAKFWRILRDTSVELLATLNHGSPVYAVYYDPDENAAIYSAGENCIFRWGQSGPGAPWGKQDSFPFSNTNAFEIAEYGQSQFLLAAGRDSSLRITATRGTEKRIHTYRVPGGAIISMDYISNGERAGKLVVGLDDGQLITRTLDERFFYPDETGTDLLFANYDKAREAHAQAIRDVIFINNGTQILSSSEDKSAKLWNRELQLLKTFLGHNDGVQTITSSDEGKTIYTGGEDKTIKKWELDQLEKVSLDQDQYSISAIAFAPQQKKLLVKTRQGAVEQLIQYSGDDYTQKETFEPEYFIGRIAAFAFSPEKEEILVASADSPDIWLLNSNGGLIDKLMHDGKQPAGSVAFSTEGKFIVASVADSAIVWKASGRGKPYRILSHREELKAVALAHPAEGNLQLLTKVRDSHKAYLWDVEAGQLIDSIIHADEVLCVAFSPDGRHLLTGSRDNSFIHRWKSSSFFGLGKREQVFQDSSRERRHTADVNFVAFSSGESPSGFLTASNDGTLRLWNIDGREEKSYIDHGAPIIQALFLSDTVVLTLGADGRVKIWDTDKVAEFIQQKEGDEKIYSLSEAEKGALLKE